MKSSKFDSWRKQIITDHKRFLLGLMPFFVLFFVSIIVGFKPLNILQHVQAPTHENQPQEKEMESTNEVLGLQNRATQIFISGGDQGYNAGGMIALASTDEPAVYMGAYNTAGDADVTIYKATEQMLLSYLTHDGDGKQTKNVPDTTQLEEIATTKVNIPSNSYEGTKVPLPLGETGIWYLQVKLSGKVTNAFVVRSNIGVYTAEGDNEFIFWGQNFKTKRSISEGTIELYNLQNNQKELGTTSFNSDGIAKATIQAEADIAIARLGSDLAIVPLNLQFLNTGYTYKQFLTKSKLTKYFIFTDRPLYAPGNTVSFKAVLRDDDDARYSIPSGEAQVEIYNGYYSPGSKTQQPVFSKKFPISSDGTINGEYELPKDVKVGNYSLMVSVPNQASKASYWDSEWSSNSISFDVEYFRKPEFAIDLKTSAMEVIAGDKPSFTISGQYFSGQPMRDQKVKYTVYASDYYEYQYATDRLNYRSQSDSYWYSAQFGGTKVIEGNAVLNALGEANIVLDTTMTFNKGKSQVFSIQATLDDGSQNPSLARKNMLVYAGEYGMYRKDYVYGTKINTQFNMPLVLIPYYANLSVKNTTLEAKIHREQWISYQEENKKYPSSRKEEEDLPTIKMVSDAQGLSNIKFTPTKIGSYRITVEGKDARGNFIAKEFYTYVSDQDYMYSHTNNQPDITIGVDKQKYEPTDTVRATIYSAIPDRDVFLTLERGRVNRFQIVKLQGKSGVVDLPLVSTDIPNIYVQALSFSNFSLDAQQINIPISTDAKKLVVKITPNNEMYRPGETVQIAINTTDVKGNPVQSEVALWGVDKALFELSDSKLGDIFNTFWNERYNSTRNSHSLRGITVNQAEGGGCFAEGTQVLLPNGTFKNIEDIKVGETVATRTEKNAKLLTGKVTSVHSTEVEGYMIINGSLRVTANHILWINDTWKEAGSIQVGDRLVDAQGKVVEVMSIEYVLGKFSVYNLEIADYHTYFAGGVWVHNQKGDSRSVFKDTAYWNPLIKTDASGNAKVSFKVPDNLTTWVLAAVGATSDTKVGQATSQIVVSKELIVRPIIPNILRNGDEVVVSALVQNFTNQDEVFDISLSYDSGAIEEALKQNIAIPKSGMQQIYWKIQPEKISDAAKLIFSAKGVANKKLVDIVTQTLPVRRFGFFDKQVSSGEGNVSYNIKLNPNNLSDLSKSSLSLSSSILSSLPIAMNYLVEYPYGCVEQTTSRFAPTIIAKANPELFKDVLAEKNTPDIIKKSLNRLALNQQSSGGWAWWYSGNSDLFVTTYVFEYLLEAQKLGINIDTSMLARVKSFIEGFEPKTKEDQAIHMYAMALLDSSKKIKYSFDLASLRPDYLSLVVMANVMQGNKNPDTNGLKLLLSQAQSEGDGLFWKEGATVNFGSKDASTALALQAIILSGGDKNTAIKAGKYLARSRKFDYWSNTYATVRVVRSLVELSKYSGELTPNFSYSAKLDQKVVGKGEITNAKQLIKDIPIEIKNINEKGSIISITKTGEGQLYSTLITKEFITDKNAPEINHGLIVRREYVNEKGKEYTLGVGDTVLVNISISGLASSTNYGVIEDELPAGMVPINESFKNEQYGQNNTYYTSYDVTDKDVTENGMILSLFQINSGERVYSYRARVVNEGIFNVPPVRAELMYAPEIYGRSKAETINIGKVSHIIPDKTVIIPTKTLNVKYISIVAACLIMAVTLIGVGIIVVKKIRKRNKSFLKKITPDSPILEK